MRRVHGQSAFLHHDQAIFDRALDLWPPVRATDAAHVYCCGRRGLMDTVRDMTGHWPTSAIQFSKVSPTRWWRRGSTMRRSPCASPSPAQW